MKVLDFLQSKGGWHGCFSEGSQIFCFFPLSRMCQLTCTFSLLYLSLSLSFFFQGFEHPWDHGSHGHDDHGHDDHGHGDTEVQGYIKEGVGITPEVQE